MKPSQLEMWTTEARALREMEPLALRVIINPTLTLLNKQLVTHKESCCSMHGFSGPVARAQSVRVTGLDEVCTCTVYTCSLDHFINNEDITIFRAIKLWVP